MSSRARPRPAVQFGFVLALLLGAAIGPLYSPSPVPKPATPLLEQTMQSVVMVMAVDIVNGQLHSVSSGSGTIVNSKGMLITNTHVIYDSVRRRMHDLFIVGRFRGLDKPPEFVCAGSTADAEFIVDIDIARLQCDRDRSGEPWKTSSWPAISLPDPSNLRPVVGQSVWVLGYPLSTLGSLQVSSGRTTEWNNDESLQPSDTYSKTNAYFSHGISGGAQINAEGEFIGVPSAFRLRTSKREGALIPTGRIGLIRPLHLFRDLLSPPSSPSAQTE